MNNDVNMDALLGLTQQPKNETLSSKNTGIPVKRSYHKSKTTTKGRSEIGQVMKTSLYLPREKFKAFKLFCVEEDVKMTEMMEKLIDEKMASVKRKKAKESECQNSKQSNS